MTDTEQHGSSERMDGTTDVFDCICLDSDWCML